MMIVGIAVVLVVVTASDAGLLGSAAMGRGGTRPSMRHGRRRTSSTARWWWE